MAFDPYYQWLGIPPEEQPADHYRLLGIRRFEHDANVIETAAERHVLLLKTRQNGPHSRLTQQLMNEVSSARLCLLDARRKAEYDAQLRQRFDSQTPAQHAGSQMPVQHADSHTLVSRPANPVILGVQEDTPLLDQAWPDASPSASSPSPLYPKAPLKAPTKGRRDRSCASERTRLLPAGSLLVVYGAAVTVLLLLAVLWLFGINDQDQSGAVSADTDRIAKSDGKGRASAPMPPPRVSDTRPPQLPAPIVQPDNPRETGPDSQGTDVPDAKAAQPGTGSPPLLVHPPVADAPVAGPGGSVQSAGLPDHETYNPGPKPGGGHPEGGRYHPSTGGRLPEGPSLPGPPRPAASTDGQPLEFDLSAAIAASGPESILLTDQFPAIDSTWQLLLEDYTSPAGTSRFSVGAVAAAEHTAQWPVTSRAVLASVERSGASPEVDGPAADGQEAELLAHLEAGPAGLFLKFSDSAGPEQIEQFSFCMLVFRKAPAEHRVYLRTRERMPPVEVKFEKARETIPLDGMPAGSVVARDRVRLEVMRMDAGGVTQPTASLQADVNKELTIPVDSQLGCELGVMLSDADGRYGLALMPRYMSNDRRQQLVAAEVKKDLARSQASATRNQRELLETHESLRSIAREIDRLSGMSPDSDQEAALMRVRMGNLQQMATNATSKVRRLSDVGPKLSRSIEQMQRVLALAEQLSRGSVLHLRVIARGEMGDLVLLQASSDY